MLGLKERRFDLPVPTGKFTPITLKHGPEWQDIKQRFGEKIAAAEVEMDPAAEAALKTELYAEEQAHWNHLLERANQLLEAEAADLKEAADEAAKEAADTAAKVAAETAKRAKAAEAKRAKAAEAAEARKNEIKALEAGLSVPAQGPQQPQVPQSQVFVDAPAQAPLQSAAAAQQAGQLWTPLSHSSQVTMAGLQIPASSLHMASMCTSLCGEVRILSQRLADEHVAQKAAAASGLDGSIILKFFKKAHPAVLDQFFRNSAKDEAHYSLKSIWDFIAGLIAEATAAPDVELLESASDTDTDVDERFPKGKRRAKVEAQLKAYGAPSAPLVIRDPPTKQKRARNDAELKLRQDFMDLDDELQSAQEALQAVKLRLESECDTGSSRGPDHWEGQIAAIQERMLDIALQMDKVRSARKRARRVELTEKAQQHLRACQKAAEAAGAARAEACRALTAELTAELAQLKADVDIQRSLTVALKEEHVRLEAAAESARQAREREARVMLAELENKVIATKVSLNALATEKKELEDSLPLVRDQVQAAEAKHAQATQAAEAKLAQAAQATQAEEARLAEVQKSKTDLETDLGLINSALVQTNNRLAELRRRVAEAEAALAQNIQARLDADAEKPETGGRLRRGAVGSGPGSGGGGRSKAG